MNFLHRTSATGQTLGMVKGEEALGGGQQAPPSATASRVAQYVLPLLLDSCVASSKDVACLLSS